MSLFLLLAVHGGGRVIRLIIRVIFVRFLFHTLGFAGGIALLVAVVLVFLYLRNRGGRRRRRGPWTR